MLYHQTIDLDGFIQVGDDVGKFPVWVAVINGYRCNISQGEESKKYWIQAENEMNGSYVRLNTAVKKIKKWLNDKEPGPYRI